MKYTVAERIVPSTDGVHNLYGKIYLPIGTPKATFQIIHGMTDHIERYHDFMEFMAENGYVTFAHDQLGHGRTAGDVENLGFIAEENGDQLLIDDVYAFGDELVKAYESIPHIVFGHSMGSFIARLFAEKHPENTDMLIIASTGGPQSLAPLGLAITDLGGRIKGADYKSEAMQKLILDAFNRSFKDEGREHAWLSRNMQKVEEYENDERSNFGFSVKSLYDLVKLSTDCNTDEWFERFKKDMPVLIISGEVDPVGENGKGVYEVYKSLKEQGVEDITFKLYKDCRHELLNELNSDEVMDDILLWTDERRASAGGKTLATSF